MNAGAHADRVAAATQARASVWASLGRVEPEPLTMLPGPLARVSARWPSTPRWRVIRAPRGTILVSDGLSDPWDDEHGVGLGLELWIGSTSPLPLVIGSWAEAAIQAVSVTVASHGTVRTMIDTLGPLSIEIDGRAFAPAARTASGRVGLLLGADDDTVPRWLTLPEGRARMVAITTLRSEELDAVTRGGQPARDALARRIAARPQGAFCND
ncbi:MAG: hypothetical protein IPK74_00980 [Deltaproteobacteria bacterium]|nr:hypothetical protein [Deltaproteobacteria bacterium]